MTTLTTAPVPEASNPASDTDRPLDEFRDCHAGIVTHLDTLGELPALLDPAARARRIAADTVAFFRRAVFEHHQEEERELFPAVLASAAAGSERDHVQALVDRLTAEHRMIESIWKAIEPELKAVAKGRDTRLDGRDVAYLVKTYREHARFEEVEFLPLSQTILGRNQNHMAALGVSLHMRHVMPSVLAKTRHRI